MVIWYRKILHLTKKILKIWKWYIYLWCTWCVCKYASFGAHSVQPLLSLKKVKKLNIGYRFWLENCVCMVNIIITITNGFKKKLKINIHNFL